MVASLTRYLKIASVALRLAAAPIALAWLWVWLAIVKGPLSPDPATNRVVPVPNHGHDVYITVLQNNLLHRLIPVGIALGVLGYIAGWLSEKSAKPTRK